MSDQPESSKTQLEVSEVDLLEELSAKLKPTTFFRQDFLTQLPKEIAHLIIAYLTPSDLMACAGVSRTWRRLYENDQTWRQKCVENGYLNFDAPSFRVLGGWAANRANEEAIFPHMDLQEADHSRREREIAYGQCYERSAWKSLYLRKKRIISNWRSRVIQSSTVIECDDSIRCLQIHSGRIVAGFHHGSLRVWNVDDAQLVFTLNGHSDYVGTCQVSDDGKYIVSGSRDATVRVWCGQTGAQLHVLRDRFLFLFQTLRVWDIVDGKCLRILTGRLAKVFCVQFDGERVVFGSDDSTVKVWNVHTGECLYTLTGHRLEVYQLLFEPERELVVSSSYDETIRVWDLRRGTCIAHLVDPQNSEVSGIELRGNILLSYSYSVVWVWDIRDGGSCIHRLECGNHQPFSPRMASFQFLDSGLVVTTGDGSVKLWDADKGIFVRDLVCLPPGGYIYPLKATETLLVCAAGKFNKAYGSLILIDFDASYP